MHDDELPLFEQPEIRHRRWFLLAIMCLSVTMVVMAVSGLNVAIPSLQRDLRSGRDPERRVVAGRHLMELIGTDG